MRSLPFIPLAFVAGADGFAMLAPYLAVFAAAVHFARWRRGRATLVRARAVGAEDAPATIVPAAAAAIPS